MGHHLLPENGQMVSRKKTWSTELLLISRLDFSALDTSSSPPPLYFSCFKKKKIYFSCFLGWAKDIVPTRRKSLLINEYTKWVLSSEKEDKCRLRGFSLVWAHVNNKATSGGPPLNTSEWSFLTKTPKVQASTSKKNVRFQMPSPIPQNVKGATGKRKNESPNNV